MNAIGGVNGTRHFSNEEEEALQRDEPTSSIVKRDGKLEVEIHGTDRSWRATKEHQQRHVGLGGALEIGSALVDGAEMGGLFHLVVAAEAAGLATTVGGPVIALGLGLHALGEAHVKGEEQARALAKDNAHVALLGVLDLPAAYTSARLDGEYKHVARTNGSPAEKIAAAINADPKSRAILQLHADRGMHTARDMTRSGLSAEAFLKANPKAAESYRTDAAFHEGFDAYLFGKAKLTPDQSNAMDAQLRERDGWYAQSHIRLGA